MLDLLPRFYSLSWEWPLWILRFRCANRCGRLGFRGLAIGLLMELMELTLSCQPRIFHSLPVSRNGNHLESTNWKEIRFRVWNYWKKTRKEEKTILLGENASAAISLGNNWPTNIMMIYVNPLSGNERHISSAKGKLGISTEDPRQNVWPRFMRFI